MITSSPHGAALTGPWQKSPDSDAPDASGWSASLYNKSVSFVYSSTFTAPVLELLSAQPGERIIDFGCGSGEVTLEIQKILRRREGGAIVGVDISESMVSPPPDWWYTR